MVSSISYGDPYFSEIIMSFFREKIPSYDQVSKDINEYLNTETELLEVAKKRKVKVPPFLWMVADPLLLYTEDDHKDLVKCWEAGAPERAKRLSHQWKELLGPATVKAVRIASSYPTK